MIACPSLHTLGIGTPYFGDRHSILWGSSLHTLGIVTLSGQSVAVADANTSVESVVILAVSDVGCLGFQFSQLPYQLCDTFCLLEIQSF